MPQKKILGTQVNVEDLSTELTNDSAAISNMARGVNIANSTFNVKDYGAVGDGVTDDTAAIILAITAANTTTNKSEVFLSDGTYLISSTLEIPIGVGLKLSHGAKILATTDIQMIWLQGEESFVEGGQIHNSVAVLTNSMVRCQPTSSDSGMDRKHRKTGLFDINLSRPATFRTGTALHLVADSTVNTSNYTEYMTFDNVNIHDFYTAVKLECIENTGELCFINGNLFSNITIDDCIDYFEFVNSGNQTPAIASNFFVNVQIQADETSENAIRMSGTNTVNINRNIFTNLMIWDWATATNTVAINLATGIAGNSFIGIEGINDGVFDSAISQDIDANTFIGDKFTETRIKSIASIASLPAIDDSKGMLYKVDDGVSQKGLLFNNGYVWHFLGDGNQEPVIIANGKKTFNGGEVVSGVFYNNSLGYVTDDVSFATTDVNTATDVITVTHNGSDGDGFRLSTTGTLPAGLAIDTNYWIVNSTGTTLQVAATKGGVVIDITTQGTGTHTFKPMTIWDIPDSRNGAAIHIMNFDDIPVILRIAPTRTIKDNFAGTASIAGQGIILPKFQELILKATDSSHYYVVFKRNTTITYEA